MDKFLEKLVNSDRKLLKFENDSQIIQQGLAPIVALSKQSVTVLKADLLEAVKLQNWKQKASLLFTELQKKHVDFLVFKGFAFTFLLYKQTHLRPYSDIDIIIKQADYDTVRVILLQIGYQQYPSRQGQFISFQNSFFDNGSPQTVIDLHWQINNRIEFHKHFTFSDLFAHTQTLRFDNTEFMTLCNIDAFILGCFHYHAHRPTDRKHIWLYDLALLWNSMEVSLQNKCLAKAKDTEQSAIVFNTLKLIDLTFDGCFAMDLSKQTTSHEVTEFYLQHRNKKMADIKTRLKNISGINNKLIFISEYVFQSRDYVKRRFGLKSKRWTYLFYPKMWLEDIFKLFR